MTYYDDIYECAVDNYYLISTKDASRLGIPTVELAKLAHRGKLKHVSHGLYRLARYVPHEYDPYAISVASVGEDAYLFGESVIAMLRLAPTNPAHMYVATPHRHRKKTLSDGLTVTERPQANDTTVYKGIPSQRVGAAIVSCIGKMMDERLNLAADNARAEGYLSAGEYEQVKEAIANHEAAQ